MADMTAQPVRIEAGKFYLTREGKRVGPMVPVEGYDDQAFSEDGKPGTMRWVDGYAAGSPNLAGEPRERAFQVDDLIGEA